MWVIFRFLLSKYCSSDVVTYIDFSSYKLFFPIGCCVCCFRSRCCPRPTTSGRGNGGKPYRPQRPSAPPASHRGEDLELQNQGGAASSVPPAAQELDADSEGVEEAEEEVNLADQRSNGLTPIFLTASLLNAVLSQGQREGSSMV